MTPDAATRLLLLSMYDYLPSPAISTGRLGAAPGPQSSAYILCETCSGAGRVVVNANPCPICHEWKQLGRPIKRPSHGCRICPSCNSLGEVKDRRGGYDPYSGLTMQELQERVQESSPGTSHKPLKALLGAPEPPVDELPLWKLRARYVSAGSYQELEQRLHSLRAVSFRRYELLMHWTHTHDDPLWFWGEPALEAVDHTIMIVARTMPLPVRVPSWVTRAQERLQTVRAA